MVYAGSPSSCALRVRQARSRSNSSASPPASVPSLPGVVSEPLREGPDFSAARGAGRLASLGRSVFSPTRIRRYPSSSKNSRFPRSSSCSTHRLIVPSLAAASTPKASARWAERGAATEPFSISTKPFSPRGQENPSTASTTTRAMSVGRGRASAVGLAVPAWASGAHTSHMPHGTATLSPKCCATCRCRHARASANCIIRSARARACVSYEPSRFAMRFGVSSGAGSVSFIRIARPTS